MKPRFHIETLAIIGVGMIGGSLAKALRNHGYVDHIIGVDISDKSLQRAYRNNVIDEIAVSSVDAAAKSDVIVLATPVGAMSDVFRQIAPAIEKQVITDVGSVKDGVVRAAKKRLGDRVKQFVPGHPIAGKERSGVLAARANLFREHNVVLTPSRITNRRTTLLIKRMWAAVGATTLIMDARKHDEMLSVTSHLPHLLSYAMVEFFAEHEERIKKRMFDSPENVELFEMVAGGFYAFTRTASSNAEMWRDIFMMNRREVVRHLDKFIDNLEGVREKILDADGDALERKFVTAKETRAKIRRANYRAKIMRK